MSTIFQTLAQLDAEHELAVLCTVIRSSGSTPRHATSKMLVFPDGHILGTIGGGEMEKRVIQTALDSLVDGKSRVLEFQLSDPEKGDVGVCGGKMEVFLEPVIPNPMLVVIGGGHVGKAVAHLAKWLGFHVVLSDDRPEFCNAQSNPDADEYCPAPMEKLPEYVPITNDTYIVLTTRGSNVDILGLPALLETPAAYIGIIGSRKRWAETRKGLEQAGISMEKINSVHSPIGLGLGAETPEEIAISIMAEVIQVRYSGSGKPMKDPR